MKFEFDILKRHTLSSNSNMSRDLLVSSAASSMNYAIHRSLRVKSRNSQEFFLSYVLLEPKFYKKNQLFNGNNKTYVQASKNNIDNIIKIKDAFSKLLAKKIIKIHNLVNNKKKKIKLRINMTTKDFSRK